ncbi:MAG: hypothetical protein FD174_2960 [Geobacteraceae bacterium]|nr:MAG: hypothetical protein FD174_2960 [Geobacteraceae bacterium]
MKKFLALCFLAVLFGCGGGGSPTQSPTQGPLQSGQVAVSFWATDFTATATSDSYYQTTATKVAEGVHCYVYLEQGQTVSQTALDTIVNQFDTNIYPRGTTAFGSEPNPGIDGDPKIYILLLNVRDGFSFRTNPTFVAGYFDPNSEYAPNQFAFSNQKEILYMNINHATGAVPGDTEFNSTIAHEFQHIIHWEQKAHQRNLNDDTWLAEAMAMVAQTYCTYGPNYDAVFDYETDVHANVHHSLTSFDESVGNYGMVYLWAQYMKDQFDTPAIQSTGHTIFWEMLHNASTGINEVNAALAAINSTRNFKTVFQDWAVANYFGNGNTKTIPPGNPAAWSYTSIDTWGTHTFDTNISVTLPGLFSQNAPTLTPLDAWSLGYYSFTPVTTGTVTWKQNTATSTASFIDGNPANPSVIFSMVSNTAYPFANSGYLINQNPSSTSYTSPNPQVADTVVHTAIGSVAATTTAIQTKNRPRSAAEYLAAANANPMLRNRAQKSGRPRPLSVDSYLRERENALRAQGIRPPF